MPYIAWQNRDNIEASDRNEWRSWLEENHAKVQEIWLVYYKKSTGKPTVTYTDSVEEALCFGWIDGLKKSIDSERYAYRFTPRKAGSKWSPLNIRLAKKMIEKREMTEAGFAAFDQRVNYDEEILKARSSKAIPLTPEIEKGLQANKKAWKNFKNLAPSYRKQYVAWLRSAKKAETREKRLKEVIERLKKNEKLGMK